MVSTLAHRGPDGDGTFYDAEAGIALGHTRLAIIDLNESANQPMTSGDGRYVITFNGEIYNYRDIRARLAARGSSFRTQSDTEVLLELFAAEGASCLEELQGIFAFAIWDRQERVLFLARDHIGVKPLYYAMIGTQIVFASEIKAILRCPSVGVDIDPGAVAAHLGYLWTADESTMLKSVRKLRPGHYAVAERSGIQIKRFYHAASWRPEPEATNAKADDFLPLFDQVVADQMVADVPVGALLSGGVDSSAIAASMAIATEPSRVQTFCAKVSGTKSGLDNLGDDIRYARMVAQQLGVPLIEVATDTELIDELPSMLWALDEPTADFAALQALKLAEAARDAGLKVLMSGVGGDDILTGYPRHSVAYLRSRLEWVPGARPLVAALAGMVGAGSVAGRRAKRLGQLLSLPADEMIVEAMSFTTLLDGDRSPLLSADIRAELARHPPVTGLTRLAKESAGRDIVTRQLHMEINAFVPDHNLNYVDKMSMQAGVEVRVPFLDPRLVEFAAALPLHHKIGFGETKRVLRRSQKDRLPRDILNRPKQGFGVPVRGWLMNEARDMLEDLTSTSVLTARGLFDAGAVDRLKQRFFAHKVDAAQTLFAIMAMEIWCRGLSGRSPVR